MQKTIAILVVSCAGVWILSSKPAMAQNYNTYGANSATVFTPSPVSPYLNLGVAPNGLSNYQTLVKPMLDEQDALTRQSQNLQQLQKQIRRGPARPECPRGQRAAAATRAIHELLALLRLRSDPLTKYQAACDRGLQRRAGVGGCQRG